MRTIKFRYWATDRKQYYYDIKSSMFLFLQGYTDTVMATLGGPKVIVPQQFTGILDSNGKEIYEGDILKFTPKYKTDSKFVGEVFYREDDGAFYHTFEEGRPSKRLWGAFSNYEYKIIGNIFENPKLLK
jgi:uncharacterized phage protein (TIGR01671 family)